MAVRSISRPAGATANPHRSRVSRPRTPQVTGPDGRRVRLADLPLVAFWLSCNHTGREYAVSVGDLVFCVPCGATSTVVRATA